MDLLSAIQSPIMAELTEFRQWLDGSLHTDNPVLSRILDHVQRGQGKMMRPMLVLLSAKLCGPVSPTTYQSAVALELLHNASLVHDDVVDQSERRRGLPSVEAKYGNRVAVLAGDFILATSLVQIADTHNPQITDLVARLGQVLVDGELWQLALPELADYTEALYYHIIDRKTASLFATCAQCGALSVGADNESVSRLRDYGQAVGRIFQVKDDIFDYFPEGPVGKPTRRDMAEGKLTLPVLFALGQHADPDALRVAARVLKQEATPQETDRLADFAIENGGIAYAQTAMANERQRAIDALSHFPHSPLTDALQAYADYAAQRSM